MHCILHKTTESAAELSCITVNFKWLCRAGNLCIYSHTGRQSSSTGNRCSTQHVAALLTLENICQAHTVLYVGWLRPVRLRTCRVQRYGDWVMSVCLFFWSWVWTDVAVASLLVWFRGQLRTSLDSALWQEARKKHFVFVFCTQVFQ